MRLIYNSDAQRLQKNFDDKTPVTVSELFRSERTASVPIELFLVDNDGGYATPGTSDYEVLIGRQAQAVTTGKLTLTFTGTTEEIDLSKPKLATRIEAALNAVSEVNAAGGVDVVELKNGRAFQITFRSVGSRAAITAGVKDSMQPASVLISEVTAGTGSTREVQLLTLEEASLAEVSTSGWSANSNPALTITTLVEGTANTREVVQLSVSNDPAPGSFFVVSNSEPISTEATAAQVKTILNSALSNDIGSVKKTGERIWQITYKTNGDKTALSAGTHNLVKRPSVNATLSLNTTALAYAANSDGSDLSVGFTLKKSNEVLLSENVDLAEPFAEVIGSSAMLNNDSLGALFTIAGDDVNKGTAISLSGGLTYSSDTLAAPFLPLAGGTMTGNAVFNDGVKAIFGTASDGIELYHQSNHSYLADTGTGALKILGSQIEINNAANSENIATFTQDGGAALFFNNSKKIESTNLGCTISGKLIVNGDMDVSGTTTTFNSTTVTVDDPIFTVGGDTAPGSDDNKDRGIEFRYYSGSAKIGFFGYDDSENAFTFLTDATNNSEVFSGTLGNLKVKTVYFADGTEASPSVRFNVDSDTGIFRPTANNLAFTTGGTEAARFDSSGHFKLVGNIEVGGYIHPNDENGNLRIFGGNDITNDAQILLHGSSDSWGSLELNYGYDSTNSFFKISQGSNEHLRITNGGMLGLGCTPSAKLDVQLEAGEWNVGSSFSNKAVRISGGSGGLGLAYDDTTGATIAAIHHGNSWKNLSFGAVQYFFDINGSETMRLNSTGLGIGGAPSVKLHVSNGASGFSGSYNARTQAIIESDSASGTALAIMAKNTGSSAIWFGDQDGETVGQVGYNHTNNTLNFATEGATQAILTSTGFGIGGTPSAPLDIISSATGGTTIELDNTSTGGRNWTLYSSGSGNSFGAGNFALYDADAASTRFLIDSSGNVGIGTTSPSHKLTVEGDGIKIISTATNADSGQIRLGTTGANSRPIWSMGPSNDEDELQIIDSGYWRMRTRNTRDLAFGVNNQDVIYIEGTDSNVGIGTTSPSAKLEISTDDEIVSIFRSTDNKSIIQLSDDDTNIYLSAENSRVSLGFYQGAHVNNLNFYNNNLGIGTTSPSQKMTIVGTSDTGIIQHIEGASDYAATTRYSRAGLYSWQIGIGGSSATGNNIPVSAFGIVEGADTRLTVATGGNVGIGTTSPSALLDVAAASGSAVQIKNTGTAASLLLSIDSSTNSIYSRGVNASTGRDFRIIQGSSEAMRIDSSGFVGINTTSFTNLLSVVGKSDDQTSVAKITRSHASASNDTYTLDVDSSSHTSNMTAGGAFSVKVNSGKAFKIDGNGDIFQNYINYTDESNYEALKISAESDHIRFDTQSIGSFASNERPFRFRINGTSKFAVETSGIWSYSSIYISGTGSLRNLSNDLQLTTSTQANNDIVFKPNNTEAVRITGAGRVGVGTSSPQTPMHLQFSGNNGLRIRSTSGDAYIYLSSANTTDKNNIIYFGDNDTSTIGAIQYDHNNDLMQFKTNGSNRLTLNSSGDAEILTDGKGLILSSPDGTRYKITVANDGTVTSSAA